MKKFPLPFLYRCFTIGVLILFEMLTFVYLKDDQGAYFQRSGLTISEYLRTSGELQFFLAAYAQKMMAITLSTFTITLIVLIAKEPSSPLFTINRFTSSKLFLHAIIYGLILIIFLVSTDPELFVSRPYSWASILYTVSPFVWTLYLFNSLQLVMLPENYFRLIRANKGLMVCVFIAVTTLFLFNRSSTFSFINFWSNLLLTPTIKLSALIAYLIGFKANVFPSALNGMPVFGTTQFQVEIWPACAGYEGMTLIALLLTGYCFLQRATLRLSRALWIIPFAGLAMFILNSIRILALVAIGHYWSPQMAENGFHTVAGWINLLLVLILSLFILNNAPFFSKSGAILNPAKQDCDETTLLLPLMALIASSLLVKGFTADFVWLYPIHIGIAAAVLYCFRAYYVSAIVKPSFLSVVMGIIVFGLWVWIVPQNPKISAHYFGELQSAPINIELAWIFCRVLGATLIVPICEELAFRGYIQPKLEYVFNSFISPTLSLIKIWNRALIKYISVFASLGFTALLFGALHSNLLAGSVAGLFYGTIYQYRRKIVDAICAHAITNLLLAIYVICTGYFSYW